MITVTIITTIIIIITLLLLRESQYNLHIGSYVALRDLNMILEIGRDDFILSYYSILFTKPSEKCLGYIHRKNNLSNRPKSI